MTTGIRLSKFQIGDLALRSAWEMERARSLLPFDNTPICELANALERSSEVNASQGGVTYMRPGYFEPLERVYHVRHSNDPDTPDGVKNFVKEATGYLKLVAIDGASDRLDELIDFCLELHRAFIRRIPAEGRHEHNNRSIQTEAFVS